MRDRCKGAPAAGRPPAVPPDIWTDERGIAGAPARSPHASPQTQRHANQGLRLLAGSKLQHGHAHTCATGTREPSTSPPAHRPVSLPSAPLVANGAMLTTPIFVVVWARAAGRAAARRSSRAPARNIVVEGGGWGRPIGWTGARTGGLASWAEGLYACGAGPGSECMHDQQAHTPMPAPGSPPARLDFHSVAGEPGERRSPAAVDVHLKGTAAAPPPLTAPSTPPVDPPSTVPHPRWSSFLPSFGLPLQAPSKARLAPPLPAHWPHSAAAAAAASLP